MRRNPELESVKLQVLSRNFYPCGIIHPFVTDEATLEQPTQTFPEIKEKSFAETSRAEPPVSEAPSPAEGSGALPFPTANTEVEVSVTSILHSNRSRLNLYLLRHASAGTRRANPKIDIKRPLDKDGKRHCLHLAHILNAMRLNFDLIVSSPLKRCLQTAQLIGTELGYEAKILHAKALEPNADFAQFGKLIYECRNYENVLMVGHNPTLTTFLGQLIGQGSAEMPAQTARVRLRKGSLARVSVERGPAVLQWMLEPRIVRALYDTSTKSSRRKTSRK